MTTADVEPADAPPVRLLTVCTGNVCRSPYSAALLRDGLAWARPGAFEVTSAGTHALVGRPADPGARRLLDERGVTAPGGSARLLSARVAEQQQLVLVMSDRHRADVLDECPAVHRRTIGLLDLAAALVDLGRTYSWRDLLADAGAKEVRARWKVLPEMLLALGAMPTRVTEVEDPYGRGPAAFDRMAGQVDDAVRAIVYWEARFPR